MTQVTFCAFRTELGPYGFQNTLNNFVTTDNGWGIGKLVVGADGQAAIRYFRGPTSDPFVDVKVLEGEFESV